MQVCQFLLKQYTTVSENGQAYLSDDRLSTGASPEDLLSLKNEIIEFLYQPFIIVIYFSLGQHGGAVVTAALPHSKKDLDSKVCAQ